MEKDRKELKTLSILILALVAFSLVKLIVDVCVNGIPQITQIPQGLTKEIVDVIVIITLALTCVAFLPEIYIGIKGIRVANNNAKGKAHLVWAIILIVFSVIAVAGGISNLVKNVDAMNIINLFDVVLDVLLYVAYFVYARRIAKAN